MTQITLNNSGLANTAGTITIYNYAAESGEYINESKEYLLRGVGLPANATDIAPPAVQKHSVAVFREGEWFIIADHRGEIVYAIEDGSEMEITETGDYPAGFTVLKPLTQFDYWDGEKWVQDNNKLHASQIESAEREKASLLKEAKEKISIWQTQLYLGIIQDEERASLLNWLNYIELLQKIDTNTAPDIEWPTPVK